MRKQTKLVAVLSAAALLAVGASMTSFAARGWVEESGSWYYYNNDDDYVTNDWKKSGNNWYWLGDDGAMVTDSLVEDGDYYYYVNAQGAMVTNSWVAVEPGEDADDDAPDHYWYYFGSNGKAYKAGSTGLSIKTINGKKYGFNEDSRMVYGFVQENGEMNTDENPFEEAMYYFGSSDDGAMHTDWLQYNDGSDLSSVISGQEYADQDVMWFYFKTSNGKMVKSEDGKIKTQTVRGNKYGFDENGVMVYEWQNTDASQSTPNKYFSDEYDGHLRKKTWVYAVPDEDIDADDYEDDQERWFYVDSAGKTIKSQIKKINGKKYLFADNGIMQSGLQWVNTENFTIDTSDDIVDTSEQIQNYDEDGFNLYYFSDNEESDGSMKTGKNIKIELDDDTFTFAFKNSGAAYDYREDGLVSKKIYINGILQKADSDDRYKLVSTPEGKNMNAEYLVGTSGTIVGNGKYVKDGDDVWYAVTPDGEVVEIGSDDYDKDIAKCVSDGKSYEEKTNNDGELKGYRCVDAE